MMRWLKGKIRRIVVVLALFALAVSGTWGADESGVLSGAEIISSLEEFQEVKLAFEMEAIKSHSIRVIDLMKEQMRFYRLAKKPFDISRVLIVSAALHDTGKLKAVREGKPSFHEQMTIPILKRILSRLKFSRAEIKVAEAIVGHDILGEVMKGTVPIVQGFRGLKERARLANMELSDFFEAQTLFYTSDAGSYPVLEKAIFTKETGRWLPKSETPYWRLKAMIESSKRTASLPKSVAAEPK